MMDVIDVYGNISDRLFDCSWHNHSKLRPPTLVPWLEYANLILDCNVGHIRFLHFCVLSLWNDIVSLNVNEYCHQNPDLRFCCCRGHLDIDEDLAVLSSNVYHQNLSARLYNDDDKLFILTRRTPHLYELSISTTAYEYVSYSKLYREDFGTSSSEDNCSLDLKLCCRHYMGVTMSLFTNIHCSFCNSLAKHTE